MRDNQSVDDMVDKALPRWPRARAARTAESFGYTPWTILSTEAGRQLRELRSGRQHPERGNEWQPDAARKRAEERIDALGWRSPPEASNRSTDS